MADSERTDDASFQGIAADRLREATAKLTAATAAEEDGSTPSEPPPASYPADDETL